MKNTFPIKALIGTCSLAIFLSGCGSDSDSTSAPIGASPPSTTSMSISPALGRFSDGTGGNRVQVTVYQNGVKYKVGDWDDASGTASVTGLTGDESHLVVQIEGGMFYDEARDERRSFAGKKMRAVMERPYSRVAVTPLTHAAAHRLIDVDTTGTPRFKSNRIVTAIDIVTENLIEGRRFGIGNPLTPPVLVDGTNKVQASDSNLAKQYALILASLSEAASGAGSDAADMLEQLAADLSDGTLDGTISGTGIPSLAYSVPALTTNINTTFATAAGQIQAAGYTNLIAIAPTLQPQVTATQVQSMVTATTAAGDSLGQARTLFSTLRSGLLPYANLTNTGYSQTQLTAAEENFRALQSSTVDATGQIEAIHQATELASKLLGAGASVTVNGNYNGWGTLFSTPELSCFNDKANLASYGAGTSFAAGCRILTKIPVAGDPSKFDQITYFVSTEKTSVNANPPAGSSFSEAVIFNWTSRIDRKLVSTGATLIRGIDPSVTGQTGDSAAATARRKGTIGVTIQHLATNSTSGSSTTKTESATVGPIAVSGDIWPVLEGTDRATLLVNVTATLNSTKTQSSTGVSDSGTIALKLDGSLIAKKDTVGTPVATLTFAPSEGTSSSFLSGSSAYDSANIAGDLVSNGKLDAKVTFATPEYQISGSIKLTGVSSYSSDPLCAYNFVGTGGTHDFNSSSGAYVPVDGGEYVVSHCWKDSEELPATAELTGSLKDLASGTMVFEGTVKGTADYSNYSPFARSSATNYVKGNATLSGTFKKSSSDSGIKLQMVVSRTSASPESYVLTYTDSNSGGLSVEAKWTGGESISGTVTNNLSSGVQITFSNQDSDADGAPDMFVQTSTEVRIAKIVGGIVTYVDGYAESIL